MEYLVSFAAQREDIILYHLFKNVNAPIYYVDVGAAQPILGSLTKAFYIRGGEGINIEPRKECVEQLNRDRPRDINLAVGISDKAGELTLYGDNGAATFDRNTQLADKKIARTVPVVTLKDVLNQYVPGDKDIHLLKIDVEGWERKCLEGMDFLRFRPWVLCIEAAPMLYNTDWEELVLGQNYVFLGYTFPNRYYAAAERVHELREYCQPDELDAIYKIFDYRGSEWFLCSESIMSMLQKQRVVLFGAGAVGQAYWKQIQYAELPLAAWVASVPVEGLPVDTLESLDGLEYDVILIAVEKRNMAEEIREILIERGVSREKILWKPPIRLKGENT